MVGRLESTVESILEIPICPNCGERAWVNDGPIALPLTRHATRAQAGERSRGQIGECPGDVVQLSCSNHDHPGSGGAWGNRALRD